MTVKVRYRMHEYTYRLWNKFGDINKDEAPKLIQEIDRQSPEGFRGTFSAKHSTVSPKGSSIGTYTGWKFDVVSSYVSMTGGGRRPARNPAIAIFVKEFGRPAIRSSRAMPIRVSRQKANELLNEDTSGVRPLSQSQRRKLESDEPIMFRRSVAAVQPSYYISNIISRQWLPGYIRSVQRGVIDVLRVVKHLKGVTN